MNSKYFSDKNIASFYLIFMSIQILFFEGWEVSYLKIAVMMISPFIWFVRSPVVTKALIWSMLFYLTLVVVLIVQFDITRVSTILYTLLFLFCFNMYYGLVYYRQAFTIDEFLKLLRSLIVAYAVVLAVQQLLILVGIRYFPPANLMGQPYLALFRSNTLAIEPSQAARVITIAFFAFLKVLEVKLGRAPSLKELFYQHRWTVISFMFVMLGMGSGTAMVGLAILSLYFVRKEYVAIIIPSFFLLYMAIQYVDYEPLTRAVATVEAALSGDADEVTKVDHSASSRVNLLLDTYNNFDITSSEMWFGQGIDAAYKAKVVFLGGITDYGFLVYLIKLGLFFSCCFLSLFSLEVLIFIIMFSAGIGNIAYGWACLMILTTMKYFWVNRLNR